MSGEREQREQTVRERAYAIWEHDGRPDGHSVDHGWWAESEMISEEARGMRDDGTPGSVLI